VEDMGAADTKPRTRYLSEEDWITNLGQS